VSRRPKVVLEFNFCGPRKDTYFKTCITVLKGAGNLPWVASDLPNPQNLTHAAVTRGPIWLYAFGPAVLLGCTPLARQCCLVALPWPGSAAWLHSPGPAVLLGCIPLARQCCLVAYPWPGSAAWLHPPDLNCYVSQTALQLQKASVKENVRPAVVNVLGNVVKQVDEVCQR